ncbi:MAG TPA: class A beta-lactamase, subclass A2 [Bacteroidia bacterium]|nr:class A beta-lactamase, subclass A2 [Bacteroidia bacterium]
MRSKIEELSKPANGTVGIAIENLETGDTLSFNGREHAVMQSVFKFPIALTILNQVDKGSLSLEQKLHISKSDLSDTMTYSPLRDKLTGRDTDISINELLHFMVSHSDNIACDIFLEKLGGPKTVNDYMHSLGINGIAIIATEKQMHGGWDVQYQNWCEPIEMTHLLEIFYKGKVLSKSSTAYLVKIMEETTTCPKRLKGLLPEGTVVAHKSGTSSTKDGLAAATNDVGIISLPNGKYLIISAFVSDAKASDTTRDAVIARIARAAYDEIGK